MGSTGSWDASLSLKRRVSLSQENENSKEEIEGFLKNNVIGNRVDYKNVKDTDIILAVIGYDDDEKESFRVDLCDVDINNMSFKEFKESGIFESQEEFYSGIQSLDEREFIVRDNNIEETLRYINLNLLYESLENWSSKNPTFSYVEEELVNCNGWIYCNNDNSDSDEFIITQEFIKTLSPGDRLVLNGDGDGEHC